MIPRQNIFCFSLLFSRLLSLTTNICLFADFMMMCRGLFSSFYLSTCLYLYLYLFISVELHPCVFRRQPCCWFHYVCSRSRLSAELAKREISFVHKNSEFVKRKQRIEAKILVHIRCQSILPKNAIYMGKTYNIWLFALLHFEGIGAEEKNLSCERKSGKHFQSQRPPQILWTVTKSSFYRVSFEKGAQSVRKKWRPPSQLSGQKLHKEAIFILQRGPWLRKSATLQRCGILHCTLSRKTTRHHHNHFFIELLWHLKKENFNIWEIPSA